MGSHPGSYRKVFIVGCPRSGTTWLADIFRSHPLTVNALETGLLDCLRTPWWETTRAAVGAAEPSAVPTAAERLCDRLEALLVRRRPPWYDAWRPTLLRCFDHRWAFLLHHTRLVPARLLRSRIHQVIVAYGRLHQLIDEAERQGGLSRDAKEARIAAAVFDEYFVRAGGTARHVLVEKTPSHLFHGRFLLGHFPEARLIEVVRDGRDVCVSMDSYKRWMPQERKYQMWLWVTSIEEGARLLADPDCAGRVLRVRYEELHRDRQAGIARLFEFAGLAATPDLVAQIAGATHISRRRTGENRHFRKGIVGDFKGRMTAADLDLFRRFAGPTLERLGYRW